MVVGGTFIEQDDDQFEDQPKGSRDKKLSLSSWQKPPNLIYLMTVLSAMGGFLFGYDTGIVGGANVFVVQVFHLDDPIWHELIVSITIISAWLFSMAAGRACDSYGRKRVILYASVIFTLGSIIMGAALNKWVLLIGRFVVGIAIGLASTAVPIYIAEVAPSNIRGSLVTLNNCFITFGQLSAAVTAGAFSYDKHNGWRWMLGLAAVPAVIQFIGFIFMPESPRWLLRQERTEEALKSLKRIRGEKSPYVLREFDKIRQHTIELRALEDRRKDQRRNLLMTIMRRRSTRRALTIGCIIMCAQQLAGINTVMYYTPTIIQMSGIQSDSAAVWLAVPAAVVYVVFSICGCLIADRMNRRTLLLSSLMGVIVSLIILGGGFHLNSNNTSLVTAMDMNEKKEHCSVKLDCGSCISDSLCGFCFNPANLKSDPTFCYYAHEDEKHSKTGYCSTNATESNKKYVFARRLCPQKSDGISMTTWMVLVGLVLYLASFAPGMGPMPWTINSEIYPMWARSSCYSIATSINWGTNILVSSTFIHLAKFMTQHGVFYLYAVISCLFWILLFFELPETRGRSLDDIEQLFAKRKSKDERGVIPGIETSGPDERDDGNENGIAAAPVSFDQLALITTQMGIGGHRHSIVVCHEDYGVLNSDDFATSLAKRPSAVEPQHLQDMAAVKEKQKTQAIADAAAAAEELAYEADKLANPLSKRASQGSVKHHQSQQQQIPSDQKRKYSTDAQQQTQSNEQS